MTVTPADVIPLAGLVTRPMVQTAARTCADLLAHVQDRKNLHARDDLERYSNLLMGEIAELAVIAYCHRHGKYAESAVNKQAGVPDAGHDVVVRRSGGGTALCSVKSSLSYKYQLPGIIANMRLAFAATEPRDINVQVYYCYDLNSRPRTTVPSLGLGYIVGWVAEKKLRESEFAEYNGELRKVVEMKLKDVNTMAELLSHLT